METSYNQDEINSTDPGKLVFSLWFQGQEATGFGNLDKYLKRVIWAEDGEKKVEETLGWIVYTHIPEARLYLLQQFMGALHAALFMDDLLNLERLKKIAHKFLRLVGRTELSPRDFVVMLRDEDWEPQHWMALYSIALGVHFPIYFPVFAFSIGLESYGSHWARLGEFSSTSYLKDRETFAFLTPELGDRIVKRLEKERRAILKK